MNRATLRIAASALLFFGLPGPVSAGETGDIEKKVDDLLANMTIEEKAGQCNQSGFGPYEKYMKSKTGMGHMVAQQGGGTTSRQAAARANQLQKIAAEETRLGIPLLIGCDGILDARVADSSTFPQLIGMGSTWNPTLVQRAYSVMSKEMRAVGYGRTFSPNLGIARDPRFGRTGETFGEDTYLTTRMGVAAVKGLKGKSLKTGIMATPKHFAAYDATLGGKDSSQMDVSERTLREVWLPPFKAAVNEGAGGIMCAYQAINGVPCAANKWLLTDILKREWGFDGFVVTDFMCVKSLWDGHHVVGSFDEAAKLGFESGVDIYDHDIDDDFAARLARLVKEGKIAESVLNEACRRTLRAKFKLGLFDNPYVDPKQAAEIVGCSAHKKETLQVARESLVLLKNEGNLLPLKKDIRSIAVIGPNADSIRNQLGVWVREVVPKHESSVVTILQGIRNSVSSGTKVRYVKGCEVMSSFQPLPEDIFRMGQQIGLKGEYFNNKNLAGEPALIRVDKKVDFDWGNGSPDDKITPDNFSARWTAKMTPPTSGRYEFSATVDDGVRVFVDGRAIIDDWPDHVGTSTGSVSLVAGREYDIRVEYHESGGGAVMKMGIAYPSSADAEIRRAAEVAKQSDVAIVVVGDCPELNAEQHDRADLNLTGHQQQLVETIDETGTPVVVVLVNARPLTVNYIAENIPAVVEAWKPGQQGGTAVAEVLFGDYNPGGKLPITFPRSTGQLPVYYNYEPGWHGGHYACGTPSSPLFPFGYGLSYTRFEYGNLRLTPQKISTTGQTRVRVDVQNTGDRKGDEIVQLYIHDKVASLVTPARELKGFKRVTLKPGEKKTVTLTLSADQLAFYDRDMKRVVEPGAFDVMVGGSSTNLTTISLGVE